MPHWTALSRNARINWLVSIAKQQKQIFFVTNANTLAPATSLMTSSLTAPVRTRTQLAKRKKTHPGSALATVLGGLALAAACLWWLAGSPELSPEQLAQQAMEYLSQPVSSSSQQQEALKASNRQPGAVIAGVRPVHVQLKHGGIPANLEVSEMMGSEQHLHVNANGTEIIAIVSTLGTGNHTDTVELDFLPECIHLFDPNTEKNLI